MASISETYVNSGVSHSFNATLSALIERVARYRAYRTTLNELKSLSARDLSDLGMNPSNIRSVAYEATYGAQR